MNPGKVVATIPAIAGDDLKMIDEFRSGKVKNRSSLLMIARVNSCSDTHYPHQCWQFPATSIVHDNWWNITYHKRLYYSLLIWRQQIVHLLKGWLYSMNKTQSGPKIVLYPWFWVFKILLKTFYYPLHNCFIPFWHCESNENKSGAANKSAKKHLNTVHTLPNGKWIWLVFVLIYIWAH